MRYELFQAARDHGAAYMQLYLPISSDLALERNQGRSGLAAVPQDALKRMASALEPPQPERFAWEACTLVVPAPDGSACSAAAVQSTQHTGRRPHAERSSPQQQRAAPSPGQEQQQPQTQSDCQAQPDELQQAAPPREWPSPEAVAAICEELWRLWGPPPPPLPSEAELAAQREAGRAANAASLLHGLDLRTRRALGEAVARAPEAQRQALARSLNERRRALLQAARDALAATGQEAGGGGSGGCDGGVGGESIEWLREQEAAFMRAAGV